MSDWRIYQTGKGGTKLLKQSEEEKASHLLHMTKYKWYCINFEPVNYIWFVLAEDMDMLNYFDGVGIA